MKDKKNGKDGTASVRISVPLRHRLKLRAVRDGKSLQHLLDSAVRQYLRGASAVRQQRTVSAPPASTI